MTRPAMHAGFAAAAVLCVAALVTQGLRLRQAIQTNRAIAASAQWAAAMTADTTPADAAAPITDARITLAHGAALSQAGNAEGALRLFNSLVARGDRDSARAALFDSANLYLRQGIRATGNPAVFLPMMELAKQRYRELLRADPSDWDARFNLERALRYAPEDTEAFEQPDDRSVERPPNKLPDLLAPDLP